MVSLGDTVEAILSEYDSKTVLYGDFLTASTLLLEKLIRLEDVRVHSVTSRLKDRQSLAEKLTRVGKSYSRLTDITDVVGLRVITHLEDEVDSIGLLVQREFAVDHTRSIDKRKILDPDRFGYLSLHYICKFSPERVQLPEYHRFDGLSFEIQVRSILQHTCAEIEHDLGYKAGGTIPGPIRRRFYRLAGLLEIADTEFTRLRNELRDYAETVQKAIDETPSEVGLDDVSLAKFIDSDPVLRELDEAMARYVGARLLPNGKASDLAAFLKYVGIETIDHLRRALGDHGTLVRRQWEERLRGQSELTLTRGIGLFHLFQVLLVLQGGEDRLTEGFDQFTITSSDPKADEDQLNAEVADTILELSKAITD